MNLYIPDINFKNDNRKSLFILTRPFWSDTGWSNTEKSNWNISDTYYYTNCLDKADVYFIPKPINFYSRHELYEINLICIKQGIKAFGFISGDFGEDFGKFSNVIFFRMGGFKSRLSENNKGFPVSLSDHFERIYKKTEVDVRDKQDFPVIGFCGHADISQLKRIKEIFKFSKENVKRFFRSPFRRDYEPFFPSAFERAKLLQSFEESNMIKTNFVYRKHYRAGAVTNSEREKTTLEYYENIKNSDYVMCVRGAGNFSVRLYETLMMGRIPILINTDCLLPFDDIINWKDHVIWIEWKNRQRIDKIVIDFHTKMSNEDFKNLQLRNRKLWKTQLSVAAILKQIENDIQLS